MYNIATIAGNCTTVATTTSNVATIASIAHTPEKKSYVKVDYMELKFIANCY